MTAFRPARGNQEKTMETEMRVLGPLSTLYCLTISLANGGAGIGAVMGEPEARKLARQAGFSDFRRLAIEDPFSALYELRA
jgi:hypothetical protein